VSGQVHATAALPSGKVSPLFWDGPQSGSGQLGEEKNLLVLELSVAVCKELSWDLAFVVW
jgi:hypothetical protein